MVGLQISHLKCPKCGGEFDLRWLPGDYFHQAGIFYSVKCPICKKRSEFDVYDTVVDPNTHHCEITLGTV